MRYELIAPLLNPKRLSPNDEHGVWYPYYAGFSGDFAESLLSAVDLPPRSTFLDPWAGSGTSVLAASKAGLDSVGFDLNPFAVVLTVAQFVGKQERARADRLAERLSSAAAGWNAIDENDSLLPWLPAEAVAAARTIRSRILDAHDVSDLPVRNLPPVLAFLMLCLVRAVRDCARRRPTSNPTWTQVGRSRRIAGKDLAERFRNYAATLQRSATVDGRPADVGVGDARRLPLRNSTIDLVVASPPYCTRIDYAVKTKLELATVLNSTKFSEIRKDLMGTTAIRSPHLKDVQPEWPSSLRQVLQRVRQHGSHRSEGYYFRNLLQYFSDAFQSVHELARVLRPGGAAFLVLQTSFYKEVPINLPELFIAIGRSHGLSGATLAERSVGRVMTTLNSKSRKYLKNRKYVESLIRLHKS